MAGSVADSESESDCDSGCISGLTARLRASPFCDVRSCRASGFYKHPDAVTHHQPQPLHDVGFGSSFGFCVGVGSSRASASFVVVIAIAIVVVGRFGCFLSSHVLSYRRVCVCVAVDAALHLSPYVCLCVPVCVCLHIFVHVCVCVSWRAVYFSATTCRAPNAPCGIFGVSWNFEDLTLAEIAN